MYSSTGLNKPKVFLIPKPVSLLLPGKAKRAISYLSLRNELKKLFQPIQTARENEVLSLLEVDTSHHDNIILSKDLKLYSTGSPVTLNKANVPLCKTALYTAQTWYFESPDTQQI